MFSIEKIIAVPAQLTEKEHYQLLEKAVVFRDDFSPAINYLERPYTFPGQTDNKRLLLAFCYYYQGDIDTSMAYAEKLGISARKSAIVTDVFEDMLFPTFDEFTKRTFWKEFFKKYGKAEKLLSEQQQANKFRPTGAYVPWGAPTSVKKNGAYTLPFQWGYVLDEDNKSSSARIMIYDQSMDLLHMRITEPHKRS